MGMYKSPIDIIYGQMEKQMEGDILRAVQRYGINVDKEELIRALQYDREQYEKGYADAKAEVVHGHWYKAPHHPYRCSCCGEMALLDMYGESHERSNYCPNCGAKMDGDGNG